LLLLVGDEVGVVLSDKMKVVCLPGCCLFRMKDEKLPHLAVFPLFNRCRRAASCLFIVLAGFKTAKARFARIQHRQAFIARSKLRWVRKEEFQEWAEWCREWMDRFRAAASLWAGWRHCSGQTRRLTANGPQGKSSASTPCA
jgi:hypothetical protein